MKKHIRRQTTSADTTQQQSCRVVDSRECYTLNELTQSLETAVRTDDGCRFFQLSAVANFGLCLEALKAHVG